MGMKKSSSSLPEPSDFWEIAEWRLLLYVLDGSTRFSALNQSVTLPAVMCEYYLCESPPTQLVTVHVVCLSMILASRLTAYAEAPDPSTYGLEVSRMEACLDRPTMHLGSRWTAEREVICRAAWQRHSTMASVVAKGSWRTSSDVCPSTSHSTPCRICPETSVHTSGYRSCVCNSDT